MLLAAHALLSQQYAEAETDVAVRSSAAAEDLPSGMALPPELVDDRIVDRYRNEPA